MKINFETTATLDREQIFALMKEIVEKKTNKTLANIYWEDTDNGMTCKLVFCAETIEFKDLN